jgi:hypothetical protein
MKTFKKTALVASILAATLTFGQSGHAEGQGSIKQLTGIDEITTTFVTKSKIAGSLEKDANGNLAMDANGNFKFNFSGDIYYPMTNVQNGELKSLYGPTGTVSGQAAFPPAFAGLAIQIYQWLQNGADPSQMPAIPAKIDWTLNDITIVEAGTTYRPIPTPGMTLEGRAFTGLGPVEIGQLLNGSNGLSMSVRMGGCFAVQAVSGPHAGMIGTYCLNSTFTFDLSGINLSNPMTSTLNGTGTSNCWTVIHQPMTP